MEQKNIKISLIGCLFIICVLAITLCAYFTFEMPKEDNKSNEKNTAVNETVKNEEQVTEDESEILVSPAEDLFTIYNEENPEISGVYITETSNVDGNIVLKGITYTKYTFNEEELKQIVEKGRIELDGANYEIKNGELEDAIYELYEEGKDYPLYKITKEDNNYYSLYRYAQIMDVWKLTGKYVLVTLEPETEIFDDFTGNSLGKASEYFSEMKNENINITDKNLEETTILDSNRTFSFEFENGKCVKVNNMLTGV